MSGGYANEFAHPRFVWSTAASVWKRYTSPEQARRHHEQQDLAAKGRFEAAVPRWEDVLDAEKEVELLPFDPFFTSPLRPSAPTDVEPSHPGDYPLEMTLDLTSTEDARESLRVIVARRPPPGALERTRLALREATRDLRGRGRGTYTNPVAEVFWGARAGLYVGVRMEAGPEVEAALRPRLRKTLDALWRVVEERTSTWPAIRAPEDVVRAFNPWGPLSDERFMRESWRMASVTAIVAFHDRGERHDVGEWFRRLF